MKTMKFRIGSAMAAALFATTTFVGALALQDDSNQTVGNTAAVETTVDNSPIVYAGGFGLFPAQ